jgi:hypothetical protein
MLLFCHACGHGGHQKCYHQFYIQRIPVDLTNPPSKFPHARSGDNSIDRSEEKPEDNDSFHGEEAKWIGHGGSEKLLGTETPRGRKGGRRGASEGAETPDSIPEKEAIHFTASGANSNSRGPLHGHSHPQSLSANEKRSTSRADTSTIVEEDRGLPDEEYILVREKEALDRETTRANMKMWGHPCAAGCGHLCWMTKYSQSVSD